jgi:3-oxoacyl-[acyl-carrier-protein] synthase-1
VDSYLDTDTLEWIERNDQLHKSTNAWGFVPGEAAAFCLLCSGETARRHHLVPLGWILGVETSFEENRIKTETVCIGKGLTDAVRKVLDLMSATRCKIDNIICDQNGEAYRAAEQGFLLARTMERFVDASDFLSPADCWGDVGAASGPLFVMLASAAAQKKYGKGPSTLLWTSSEGGERAALIHWADGGQKGAA